MFTTIITHVEPADAAAVEAALATPLALAAGTQARLAALVFPAGTVGEDLPEAEAHAAAQVAAAAARLGVPCEVHSRGSMAQGVGEVFAGHLRVADLGVLTAADPHDLAGRMLAGAAIFGTGRPVVLAAAARPLAAPPTRILVAWDATPAAVRAVHGALPLLKRAAETVVATVTDDKEPEEGQSGAALARLLGRHGATARFAAVRRGRGGVHAALAAAAREAGAQMVVMGALRHAPLRDLVLGSATHDLLTVGPDLPTLVSA